MIDDHSRAVGADSHALGSQSERHAYIYIAHALTAGKGKRTSFRDGVFAVRYYVNTARYVKTNGM